MINNESDVREEVKIPFIYYVKIVDFLGIYQATFYAGNSYTLNKRCLLLHGKATRLRRIAQEILHSPLQVLEQLCKSELQLLDK